MPPFTIDMSNPFASGFTRDHGGPHSGGHRSTDWFVEFGMDLGASRGTEVRAAFDAHVTRFAAHTPARDTPKVFGAQLFMRSPNDKMGGFYTHLTDVPTGIAVGTKIRRGDLLGKVHHGHGTPHLHLALVEIIGGLPGGRYMGVDQLFRHFVSTANTTAVSHITFQQNGMQPTVGP